MYERAENSAKIFDGKPEQYFAIHRLIDSNKTVTPSIFGRFFLHHYDFGRVILKKIFGEVVEGTDAPVEEVLLQHLFEDYDMIPSFERDWMNAFTKVGSQIKLRDTDDFLDRLSQDPRTREMRLAQIKELESLVMLKDMPWGKTDSSSGNLARFSIFGHALGADLLARIIGPKFHDLWSPDVITGLLNCRFSWDNKRDLVPTLLDFESLITDKSWMHAPDYSKKRLKPGRIWEQIKEYKDSGPKVKKDDDLSHLFKTKEKRKGGAGGGTQRINHSSRRQPCNMD